MIADVAKQEARAEYEKTLEEARRSAQWKGALGWTFTNLNAPWCGGARFDPIRRELHRDAVLIALMNGDPLS